VVEGEEASEVTSLGVNGGVGLAGDLATEVEVGERREAAFVLGEAGGNVML